MPQVQLVNNCQGPHYIQPQKDKATGGLLYPLLIVQPGFNLIESKQLAEMRKANKQFDSLFTLVVPTSHAEEARVNVKNFGRPMLEVRGEALPDKSPLVGLALKDAQAIIDLTNNTDLLNGWLEECHPEKNADLMKSLKARIKAVASEIQNDAE